jgi:hypothetical protein
MADAVDIEAEEASKLGMRILTCPTDAGRDAADGMQLHSFSLFLPNRCSYRRSKATLIFARSSP